MAEYSILSEQQIETYKTPTEKIKQQVITYQTTGLAPRTVWLDSASLPDIAWQTKNPGKPVPADLQQQGDKVRRAAFDADVAKIAKAAPARKI